MTTLTISSLPLSTVLFVHTERDGIQTDPEYQRDGDIWTIEKRQLLIDSILNGYDIPKIYFHKFARPKKVNGDRKSYAIVDGKQRLLSIWQFIDGAFGLSEDFEYFIDPSVKAGGLRYGELGNKYPKLKLRFDSYPLSIVTIEAADTELIEDMFSRLNEAVPLSAAEKRNAFPGPIPKEIRSLSGREFFKKNLPFSNARYRHLDLGAKFLLTEDASKVADTKKAYLDAFVLRWKAKDQKDAKRLTTRAGAVLALMEKCFQAQDPLLRSVAMVSLYYHLFRLANAEGWLSKLTRRKLVAFEEARKKNRQRAETDIAAADYDLLEFDRLAHSPSDAFSTTVRLRVILAKGFSRSLPDAYGAAVGRAG
jgi:hypothetical protein